MAVKLEDRPGSAYDPDDANAIPPHPETVPEDDGWKPDGWDLPDAEKPEPSRPEPSVAEREASAGQSDGNKTATTPEESALGGGADDGEEPKAKGLKANFRAARESSKNKKIAAGVGVGVILSIVGAAMLLPSILMKTITEKLTDTFMGRAKYTVQQVAEKYVERYVVDVIGGTLRTCPGTKITKDCVAVKTDKKTLWGKFATNWRENRIEQKLFEKHGIEFRLDTNDRNKINIFRNGESLGEYGRNSASREAIKAVDSALEAETKFDGILTRRHIRSVLASKYGAKKWCFIACDKKDEITDKKIRGVKKLKLKMVARISEISSARTASYLLCLTTGCSPDEIKRNDKAIVDQILQKADSELVESLAKDIEKYGTKDLTELVTRKVIDKIVTKVVSQEAAKAAVKAIPIAGQIYLGATIAEFITVLDEAVEDDEISKFMRNVNQQESALYAGQMLSIAEDTQSFQAPIEDNWAAFDLLNGFGKSRVWQGMNNIQNKSSVECEDGTVLSGPDDPLTCPEQKVQQKTDIEKFRDNEVVDTAMNFVNPYNSGIGPLKPRNVIKPVLDGINATIGFVGEGLINGISALPVVGDVVNKFQDFVGNYAIQFFQWAAKTLLPRVINYEAEDEQALDQTAMGLDVVGTQFAKGDPDVPEASHIGGQLLSAGQQASLDKAIAEKKREEIQGQSFFARYFDFNNTDSLASVATLDTASLFMGGKERMLYEFQPTNVLSTVATLFGAQKQASAIAFGATDRAALFGNSQYGWPTDDPNLSVDADTLTAEQCAAYKKARLDSAYINDATDETEYTVTDPCALGEVVVDSYTKVYDLDSDGTESSNAITTSVVTELPGLNGYAIPCEGLPTPVIRTTGGNGSPRADWTNIKSSGTIGTGSDGTPINVYVREVCPSATNIKTIFIAASIHGSENGGQFIAHELLFNADLDDNIRIVAIPEINKSGVLSQSFRPRVNKNGVNLNRNFDYRWAGLEAMRGDNYNDKGPSAASEPETRALVDFINGAGTIDLALHYHDGKTYVAAAGYTTPLSLVTKYATVSSTTPYRTDNNSGGRVFQSGSFDGWQNDTQGTKTLLIEMSQNQSASIINEHVEAIKGLQGDL